MPWSLNPEPTKASQMAVDALEMAAIVRHDRTRPSRPIVSDELIQRALLDCERAKQQRRFDFETRIVFRPTYKPAWWPL